MADASSSLKAYRGHSHEDHGDEQAQPAASGVTHVTKQQRTHRAGDEADCGTTSSSSSSSIQKGRLLKMPVLVTMKLRVAVKPRWSWLAVTKDPERHLQVHVHHLFMGSYWLMLAIIDHTDSCSTTPL
jgi:hypothetical protein